jgi:cytochrome P450
MVAQWLSTPEGKVSKMVDDTRIVALHVLYAAGFGVQHDFNGGARLSAPGHKLSHRDALMTMLNNFIVTMIVAPQEAFFDKIAVILSPRINSILLALKEFRQYTDEAMALERKLLSEDRGAQRHNLMSTLICTSDQARAGGVRSAVRLTDDEIRGNIFIFNVAGHDTTANTLAYAFALLAINPEIQQWVMEEIDQVFQGEHSSDYEGAYPQLNRIMAVMVSLSCSFATYSAQACS